MKLLIVFGTRPEIIKLAPVIAELQRRKVSFSLIHTNQHFSQRMNEVFIRGLQLPTIDYQLRVRSQRHGEMTAQMLTKIEQIILNEQPSMVVVQGDTNSTLAGALAASKLQYPLAHIEAGMRSFDKSMPEEVNRVLVDHLSDLLFVPSQLEKKHLKQEGISGRQVQTVGSTVVDSLALISGQIRQSVLRKFDVHQKQYIVITLHRPSNVDSKLSLLKIFDQLDRVANHYPNHQLIWPMHPRVTNSLVAHKLSLPERIAVLKPVEYFDMISLVKHAALLVTDSGGLQEEAYILHTPCITLRDTTEWRYTVTNRKNALVHHSSRKLMKALKYFDSLSPQTWKKPYSTSPSQKIVTKLIAYDQTN